MKQTGRRGLGYDERALFMKNAIIIVVSMVIISSALLYNIARDQATAGTFARGVSINGIEVYGMSYKEGYKTVQSETKKYIDGINIELVDGDTVFPLDATDFVTANVEKTVDEAFSVGKTDSDVSEGNFYTSFSVDKDVLRSKIEEIAQKTDVAPVEPVAIFDKESRTFTYKNGESGRYLNIESCMESVLSQFRQGIFTSVELEISECQPKMTVAELEANTKFISEYTSITTNNYNRNTNIQLMCDYLNGYQINPHTYLSINDVVGERTEAKGFMAAPAIMDGKRTVDDIGGGICQLSGTLYNAALLANMRIVERFPHSWPSDYLDIGLDSTLDWNTQKDLKIENQTDYPMYIACWFEKSDLSGSNVLHTAIYGTPFPEGLTVKVRSEIVETTEPESPIYTYSSRLSPGKYQEVTKARTGYLTRVWREFYLDGVMIDKELVNTSTYNPIRGEYLVGRSSSGSYTTPSPTETPEPTSDPTIPPPETEPPIDDLSEGD